jgi:hypothetical protein
MNPRFDELQEAVQFNCHITDAKHAGQYTLCIYLLKMREYFRWENQLSFQNTINKEQLGQWLSQRESLWLAIEEQDYKHLSINQLQFDPFAISDINEQLLPHQLVYSAGYGNRLRPHFLLAEMEHSHDEDDYQIYVTGREFARDLTAPPAMAQGSTIFLRRESFRRMIWEKYEEWLWNQPDNAMKRAIAHYPFESDIPGALEQMTSNELNMALLHEIGEVKASKLLGPHWQEMLSHLARSKGEIMLRAVKDHLADSISTLPELLKQFRPESLHFYMANLTSMRKTIAPALMQHYQHWLSNEEQFPEQLSAYTAEAKEHWLSIARQSLIIWNETQDNKQCSIEIAKLVEQSYC